MTNRVLLNSCDLNILYSIQAIDGKLYSNLENVTSEREALRYERGESQKYAVPDTPESESISRKGGFSFMSKDKVIDSMGRIDDDMIQSVDALRRKKKRPSWLKWGAMAACLCLVLACAIPTIFRAPVDSPNDTMGTGPAGLVVNDIQYLISSHVSVSDELPSGFSYAGETDVGGFENCPYYTNPDIPEWVYVYQEVTTDGTVDETGALTRTDPHGAYARYVDRRLRGKDLVCYRGEYYISM